MTYGAHQGSLNDTLSQLSVGDYIYMETTSEQHTLLQSRILMPASRRPEPMRHMKFSCGTYTAVGPRVGDVRVIVRVERLA